MGVETVRCRGMRLPVSPVVQSVEFGTFQTSADAIGGYVVGDWS
jgi:hypothetical protein